MVSTKRILGTGVTLTRAFRSVNLDADWKPNGMCSVTVGASDCHKEIRKPTHAISCSMIQRAWTTRCWTDEQKTIIGDANKLIMDQAKAEYETRYKEAQRLGKSVPGPSAMSFFSKTHKLRAATVVPNMLAFAHKYGLKLTDDEARSIKDCYGPG